MSIWDDGYGISVKNKQQTTKESISKALEGFKKDGDLSGLEILTVNGWDYPELIKIYSYASKLARLDHVPVIVHVTELTQPLGHSTSGSHERYKSKERLEWENLNDCNKRMREWILSNGFCNEKYLIEIESEIKNEVKLARRSAWNNYQKPIIGLKKELNVFLEDFMLKTNNDVALKLLHKELNEKTELFYHEVIGAARKTRKILMNNSFTDVEEFKALVNKSK